MAEDRTVIDTVLRSFHVYKNVWSPVIGEILICKLKFRNIHDPYSVAVCKCVEIVGHVPNRLSSLCYFFLKNEGAILCHVTGKRRHTVDLPQGGLEVPLEVPCSLTQDHLGLAVQ